MSWQRGGLFASEVAAQLGMSAGAVRAVLLREKVMYLPEALANENDLQQLLELIQTRLKNTTK